MLGLFYEYLDRITKYIADLIYLVLLCRMSLACRPNVINLL